MAKLNLPNIHKRLSKDQILERWRKYYRQKYNMKDDRQISDAEILEQLAIEQHKGKLSEWLRLAESKRE